MPRRYYKKTYRRYRRRPVGGKTYRNRKLVTGKGSSLVEKIATYGGAVGSLARTVKNVVNMINSEQKYLDATGTGTVSTSGSVNFNTLIPQGDTDNTRDGNSVLGKDFSLKYTISMNASATNTFYRIMIICDKECDGAGPTMADILEVATDVNSPLNRDFTKRFVNLKDIRGALSTGGNTNITGQCFIKTPWHVYYDAGTAVIGSCKENQIFLILLSSEATNTPTFSWYTRFNYFDN